MLIGDKSGSAIIALTYGDVRPDHLFKQAQRIKLTVAKQEGQDAGSSIGSSNTLPHVSPSFDEMRDDVQIAKLRT